MSDPNRTLKWVLVITLVVVSLLAIYPPSEKLKGGIDLVGGTSLLLEIDTTDLSPSDQQGLSRRVIRILRERVDPQGQLNIEWRPVGNTRLEIRMPLPPKQAVARREAWEKALDELKALNISRYDVETALNKDLDDRPAAIEGLQRGVEKRSSLLEALTAAFDAREAGLDGDDMEASEEATTRYEQSMADLLAANLPLNRLLDIFSLPKGDSRDAEMGKLRADNPSYDAPGLSSDQARPLTIALDAYDQWSKHKADLEDPSDLKRRLRGAGVLEFRILAERNPESPSHTRDPNRSFEEPISKYTEQLAAYGPRLRHGDHYRWIKVENVVRFLRLDDISTFESQKGLRRPIVEEYAGRYYVLSYDDPDHALLPSTTQRRWKLRRAYPDRNPLSGQNTVSFELDPRGGQLFRVLTGSNVNRDLCIVLDGAAMSYANIEEAIGQRCQISGDFTLERVQDLVRTLEAGSLPARLKETPLRETVIGPSLGESNRNRGLQAAKWGLLSVAAFMMLYYGFIAGGMANLALAMNMLFILSVMAMNQWTFTLPGIAGLILTIGMAVDANVLILERIREERDRGVIFKKALNAGYDKAFSTIMDANITTLMTCIILGFVGSEEVKGFAITLGIGVTTSMFTSLFVTRLIFNSLIAKGWLKDLSMRRIIRPPTVDWMGLRRVFLPTSGVVVVLGLGLFLTLSATDREGVYDIEFLGGTGVQIDLKPGYELTDEDVRDAITATSGGDRPSAVQWLLQAADDLEEAQTADGEQAGQYVLTSATLTGEQMGALMHSVLEPDLERGGIRASSDTATFDSKPGKLTLESFRLAVAKAANRTREAADRLRTARVQKVTDIDASQQAGLSFEVVTIETDRQLVQTSIMAVMGDKLSVQRAVTFTTMRDEDLTKEPFFVVEANDQYLSEVLNVDALFDIRRFRGGVAIDITLDPKEEPLTLANLKRRLREVGLHPEFEQYQARESDVFPLGPDTLRSDQQTGYRRFAVLAVDPTLLYEDNPDQWIESLARGQLKQVEAALGIEKSLSKVVQFAPQIAGQAQNRAIMAIVLALGAIVVYIWLRFGNKEFGLAAIVALVHDVSVTLGVIGLRSTSRWIPKRSRSRWRI